MRHLLLLLISLTAFAIEPSEYAARRARLAQAIGPHAMLVVLPSSPVTRNADTSYPFRQSDAVLYLTGITQPETSLVLLPGETRFREVIFVSDRDPLREVWTGKIATHDEVTARTGIDSVFPSGRLRSFIVAALEGRSWGDTPLYGYYRPPGMPPFRNAVQEGRAEIWLLLGGRSGLAGSKTPEQDFARELRETYPEVWIRNATPILDAMREVKSPTEMQLIQRAIDITAEAQKAAMKRALTATHEYQVQATIEYTFRNLGACCSGFPSIVGSGRNATVLHYDTNNDAIPRDGLILTDIGAEVEGYTADLTRTYPADGTFSPEQRAVYEAVLTAQNEAQQASRPGAPLADMHLKAQEILGRELLKLGMITKNEPEQVQMYLRHGAGHPMGLDVHDVYDRTRRLEPGMVITIEPGVYVREEDIRASTAYKQLSAEDQKKIDAALARYGGIGVRIEDDYLITPDGAKLLSGAAPRTVAEIEAWMR